MVIDFCEKDNNGLIAKLGKKSNNDNKKNLMSLTDNVQCETTLRLISRETNLLTKNINCTKSIRGSFSNTDKIPYINIQYARFKIHKPSSFGAAHGRTDIKIDRQTDRQRCFRVKIIDYFE